MAIEFSVTLVETIFKSAVALMGISITILAVLSGLIGRRKTSKKAKESIYPGSDVLLAEFRDARLTIDLRKILFRLKMSIGLLVACLIVTLIWLLLIESPVCKNEITKNLILHSGVFFSAGASVITFVIAFLVLASTVLSIKFHMLDGDNVNE